MVQRTGGHLLTGRQTDDMESWAERGSFGKVKYVGSLLTTSLELEEALPAFQIATFCTGHGPHHQYAPEPIW